MGFKIDVVYHQKKLLQIIKINNLVFAKRAEGKEDLDFSKTHYFLRIVFCRKP